MRSVSSPLVVADPDRGVGVRGASGEGRETSLAEMFAERLAPYGFCCIIGGARRDIVGKSTRHSRVYSLR